MLGWDWSHCAEPDERAYDAADDVAAWRRWHCELCGERLGEDGDMEPPMLTVCNACAAVAS